jgi:anthranilate phosphoribosyltransferase
MIVDALRKLLEGKHLTTPEAEEVMHAVMEGKTTHAQIGALLGAMRARRETVPELVGFARAMRERSIHVKTRQKPLLDTCGTGGDALDTFNISTTAAFVIAAAGIPIAKHGNRAVSSPCGSADVLAALGVELSLTADQVGSCIDEVGIGFMYAPSHHPAMAQVAVPRREIGVRTVFNLLGPLTNPAGASRQLIGVFDPDMCQPLAEALGELGCERAMVVHGMDGLDEISTIGPTRISTLQNGRVITDTRIPAEFFIVPSTAADIAAGTSPADNAQIILSVLQGDAGAKRDIVAVNAAAGLILGGMSDGWRDGVALANRLISNGKALGKLQQLTEFTRRFSPQDTA